jgi:hypothetical protein
MQALTHPSGRALRVVAMLAIGLLVAFVTLGSLRGTVLGVVGTSLHQETPISWDDPGFQGTEDECAEADLAAGQVLWHFVLVQTDAASATLTAEFEDAGTVMTDSYKKTGKTLHFNIITGQDTLWAASTDAVGFLLNLSHICSNGTSTSSSA